MQSLDDDLWYQILLCQYTLHSGVPMFLMQTSAAVLGCEFGLKTSLLTVLVGLAKLQLMYVLDAQPC